MLVVAPHKSDARRFVQFYGERASELSVVRVLQCRFSALFYKSKVTLI